MEQIIDSGNIYRYAGSVSPLSSISWELTTHVLLQHHQCAVGTLPMGKIMGCLCRNGYPLAASAITNGLLLVTHGLLQLQKQPMGSQFPCHF